MCIHSYMRAVAGACALYLAVWTSSSTGLNRMLVQHVLDMTERGGPFSLQTPLFGSSLGSLRNVLMIAVVEIFVAFGFRYFFVFDCSSKSRDHMMQW